MTRKACLLIAMTLFLLTSCNQQDGVIATQENADIQEEGDMEKKQFVRKTVAEIIELDEGINVVGLSFNKCKETGFVTLTGTMMDFELYGHFDKLDNIADKRQPDTNFAVWADGDQLIGKWVNGGSEQDEAYSTVTIPRGTYFKVLWNAETFDRLVTDYMGGEQEVKDAYISEHGIVFPDHTDADSLYIEVYPQDKINGSEDSYPEAYTLTRVRL